MHPQGNFKLSGDTRLDDVEDEPRIQEWTRSGAASAPQQLASTPESRGEIAAMRPVAAVRPVSTAPMGRPPRAGAILLVSLGLLLFARLLAR